MRIGISTKRCPGIGDKIQFTSLPENYFLETGEKLIDVDKEWIFDFNPFVERDAHPDKIIDLWDLQFKQPFGRQHYTTLAERNAMAIGVPAKLAHPRLYQYEKGQLSLGIVIHPWGKTQGHMNKDVIDQILENYYPYDVVQIGAPEDELISHPRIIDGRDENIWTTAKWISKARVFIGVDSGPSWIAACYPRTWNKKVLMQSDQMYLSGYLGMQVRNSATHWHDCRFSYYNKCEFDVGITLSYLKL